MAQQPFMAAVTQLQNSHSKDTSVPGLEVSWKITGSALGVSLLLFCPLSWPQRSKWGSLQRKPIKGALAKCMEHTEQFPLPAPDGHSRPATCDLFASLKQMHFSGVLSAHSLQTLEISNGKP